MGQQIRKEIVGQLLRTSGTNVSLAQSVLNIGGQQYATQTNLLMDISTSGFGGLDTGTVAASTTYHLYAVVNNAGFVGLVTSLNLPIANGPVGFPNWKYLWSIHTDQSSLILDFQRVGKKNVFIDSLTGIKSSPSVANNNPALVIDTSGGVSPWPNGTSTSNNATFTSNMLNGLADEFEGVFFVVGDGGSTGLRARLFQDNTVQGNIAALGAFISVVGVLFTAPYVGTVGATYFIEMASSLAERDLVNKILSYDNKLVDESSSAGTIVNIADFIPGPKSESWVQGAIGHGSTNTAIRTFSSVVTNLGSDISYFSSALNGDSWRINSDGLYAIEYYDSSSGSANRIGISLNSTQLSINIDGITSTDVLVQGETGASSASDFVGVTKFLSQGDIIRAHTNASPDGTSATRVGFRITKVANAPLATAIGPRSEIWVQVSAGSVPNTYISTWANVLKNVGSAITYVKDAVNGDTFTVNEDGIYAMSYNNSYSGSASYMGITINDTQLTTVIYSINTANRLTMMYSPGATLAASLDESCSVTMFLAAGSVIRNHNDINCNSATGNFHMVKVSN